MTSDLPVTSGTFEKTSLSWQIRQLQQRMGEALERLFAREDQNDVNFNWQLPDWLEEALFWLIAIGLILWAGWQLYKLLQPYFSSYFQPNTPTPPLPPGRTVELTASDWLKRSRQSQQQGNYREACRALYMAALQQLNDKDLIRQELSRTDGEYLNLIQDLQNLSASQPYQTLIHIHERLCFSDTTISAEVFDRCWAAYREIEEPGVRG